MLEYKHPLDQRPILQRTEARKQKIDHDSSGTSAELGHRETQEKKSSIEPLGSSCDGR